MNEIIKRMNEIKARRIEIRGIVEAGGEANLDTLITELRSLDTEMSTLEARKALLEGINNGIVPASSIPNPFTRGAEDNDKVYRSAFFKTLLGQTLTDAESRSIATSNVAGAIPTETANEVIRKLKQLVPMLNEVTLLHVAGNVSIAVEGTKNAASLHTENGEINESEDSLVTITLGSYEIVKLIRISKSVRTMTISAFESWLVDMITESLAEKIEDYLVNGDGSSKPKGVAYANTWTDNTSGIAWAGAALANVDITEGIALLPADMTEMQNFS